MRPLFARFRSSAAAVTPEQWQEVESALIAADVAVRVAQRFVEQLRRRHAAAPAQALTDLLQQALAQSLACLEPQDAFPPAALAAPPASVLVVGANGAGKTTSIGKLLHHFSQKGHRTLLAACDTFRAAAGDQLRHWAERLGAEFFSGSTPGAPPAAIAFDAFARAQSLGCDLLLLDTAGRLPTQPHLMAELQKIQRVAAKAHGGAPNQTWLVLDGTSGQNALEQARAFDAALGITGLILTKLDSGARGGVLLSLALQSQSDTTKAEEKTLPVRFLGIGEAPEDLLTFNATSFARALMGE